VLLNQHGDEVEFIGCHGLHDGRRNARHACTAQSLRR
jgi:hypothetical protein